MFDEEEAAGGGKNQRNIPFFRLPSLLFSAFQFIRTFLGASSAPPSPSGECTLSARSGEVSMNVEMELI